MSNRDFKKISQFKWHAEIRRKKDGTIYTVYAAHTFHGEVGKPVVRMHRFILGIYNSELDVDHKDNDGLNNQRSNLRITKGQNTHNSRLRADNTSGFKGVSLYKPTGKWRAGITFEGRAINLGYFPTPEAAAKRYDQQALYFFGMFALTNASLGLLGGIRHV